MPPKTDKSTRQRLDPRMRASLAGVAVSGGALALGGLVLAGPGAAFSIAVGAGLALGNLWALARIVVALLPEEPESSSGGLAGWALLGALKMFALMGAVWLLMRHGIVSPIPMVIGFGALPMGIAMGALVSDRSSAAE